MRANAPNTRRTPEPPAESLRRPHPSRPSQPGRQALGAWLYAVTRGRRDERERTLLTQGLPAGVAGEPVRLIDGGGLTAVVGTVDLREFGAQALRRKLEDLEWLGAAARAHDRVITALARNTATVPVGLATVFSGDESVRAMLDAQREKLDAALSRLEGRTEWGVKAYAVPVAQTAPTAAPAAASTPADEAGATGTSAADGTADDAGARDTAGGEGAGAAFLRRRRAQLARQRSTAQSRAERAERIHARLSELSVSSRRYAPQNPALTGRREQMLLNGAYLVDDERLDGFRSAVAALDAEARAEGVHVELTGPWPSYSFTAEGLAGG